MLAAYYAQNNWLVLAIFATPAVILAAYARLSR